MSLHGLGTLLSLASPEAAIANAALSMFSGGGKTPGSKISAATSGMDLSSANLITGAIGIGKIIAGKVKQKKADAMLPQYEDPEERRLQREFSRRKRAFRTGTALAAEKNSIKEMAREGMMNSFRAGGGLKGIALMSRMYNEGVRDLKGQALAGESQYSQMEQQQVSKLADRKLQLGLLKYNTAQARAAQTLKEGKATANIALSKIIGVGNPYDLSGNYPYSTED